MKRISVLLLIAFPIALLIGSARASDGKEFTHAQAFADPFAVDRRWDRPALPPGSVRLTPVEIDRLILPEPGQALSLPSIDRFTGNDADPLLFHPVSLFAPDARIRVLHDGRETEQLRPTRQYYVASNASTGVGLAVDPVMGTVSGIAVRGGDRLAISGDFLTQLQFSQVVLPDDASITCGNDDYELPIGLSTVADSSTGSSVSEAQSGTVISYQALVAVDTDSEWLDGFGDDENAAMEWISDLFLAMNVFYERDVETRLLIGDVILRTGSDPYSVQNNRSAQLSEFGEYWMDNMAQVERQFAAMFSGRNISSWGFSGIAWINQYCDYGHGTILNGSPAVAGSFSYNAIGSSFSASSAAHFVGHELGHNLGSPHTHCYSPAVDHCSTSGNSCYQGPTSCPADGSGTVMSYCHNLGGCTADSEFHPTVQALIESRLASELVAGCIVPYTETIPEPEVQTVPSAGADIDFGEQLVGGTTAPQAIAVQNTGDADLTVSCVLSGPDPSAFNIENCTAVLSPAQSANVELSCSPGAAGQLQASLTLITNDADEGQVVFDLLCTGTQLPVADMIFGAGFEN